MKMIPKIIHYCWFGHAPLPRLAQKCIASWKKYLPDYEIREWNEDNFDVNIIPYTRAAYACKKYAFVSDYTRFHVLYHYGGLYFDTDVEVIRPMDDIIAQGPFMGIEKDADHVAVAPGLGMGAYVGMKFYKEMIDFYADIKNHIDFIPTGILVSGTTKMLIGKGFVSEDHIQQINGIRIYPNEYFNPMDDYTGKIHITDHTKTIHHYAKSWIAGYGPLRKFLSRRLHRLYKLFAKTACFIP